MNRAWKIAFWLLAAGLIGYALLITPLAAVWGTLRQLRPGQILVLTALNTGIIGLFAVRWWWILRAQGHAIPLLQAIRYRLAAFGVSYFTPGPQFGGEPLQVFYLRRDHGVPTSAAIASLSLDKVLELLANFTFLVFGLLAIASRGLLNLRANAFALAVIIVLAALPWLYLLTLYTARLPLSALSHFAQQKLPHNSAMTRMLNAVQHSEAQMSAFCRQRPRHLIGLMLVSALVWLALVGEYGLMLAFLGARLDLWGSLVFITSARLAFLAPLPGGLGSLEISQVLAAQSLGLENSLGISIGLLIRLRDIVFGLLGLLWGGVFGKTLKV